MSKHHVLAYAVILSVVISIGIVTYANRNNTSALANFINPPAGS